MPMRCRWPPLNACGKRRMYSGRSPTSRRSSATRSPRSCRLPTRFTSSGSPTMSSRVFRGFNEENGSWKIICICRRSGRRRRLGRVATSTTSPPPPRKRISPEVGVIARRMQRAVVVLPQPLSPTRDSVSPGRRSKLTSSTARTWPTSRRRSPRRIGKYFRRRRTSRRRPSAAVAASRRRPRSDPPTGGATRGVGSLTGLPSLRRERERAFGGDTAIWVGSRSSILEPLGDRLSWHEGHGGRW